MWWPVRVDRSSNFDIRLPFETGLSKKYVNCVCTIVFWPRVEKYAKIEKNFSIFNVFINFI